MIKPDFGIKQFVPEDVCLKCQGCCRFREEFGVWLPCLLDAEVLALKKNDFSYSKDKKIIPALSKEDGVFFCPFLNRNENECLIYSQRLFDCQLYPFVINRKGKKVFLAVDLNCDFVKNNFKTVDFNRYAEYLLGLLTSQVYRNILKNNPQIIQLYPEVVNLAELGI